VAGDRPEAERIEVLKEEPLRTAVYRLHLQGGRERTVIAKRSRHDTARVERTIYEQILPELPIRLLRYYGSVSEPSNGFCWLFIEEARGRRYRPKCEEHRRAAARWLAALHGRMGEPTAARSLPARDPDHYRSLLGSQREGLLRRVSDSGLRPDDRTEIAALVAHCDQLDVRWSEIDRTCRSVPATLVHGDFVNHNVFVRSESSGLVLLPFDWEKAGWGTPAEDLSSVDVETYWRALYGGRSGPDLASLRRLARVGRVLRCLVFLDWAIPRLAEPGDDTALDDIRLCRSWLDQLLGPAPGA
jgi:Ser/Thr protein kinase RdoA (MazF antagonist)